MFWAESAQRHTPDMGEFEIDEEAINGFPAEPGDDDENILLETFEPDDEETEDDSDIGSDED